MSFAKIISTGIYVPEKIVTNEDLSGILGEDWRRVVRRIHSERHQLQLGRAAGEILDTAHLMAHHRAGTVAGRIDKVRHPDMSVERVAVERLIGL